MVGFSSYHDQWLSEGFADFSASLFLQNTGDVKMEKFLKYWEHNRKQITEKNQFGFRATDAGPVWMGQRLDTYRTSSAYRRLIYPKGGFVLHMLRMLMFDAQTGDQNFIALMQDFTKTYAGRSASTEAFIQIAEKHIIPSMNLTGDGKLGWFFGEWIYGPEVPSYKLEYSLSPLDGGKVLFTGRVTQSDVSNNFAMRVPVYGDFGNGPVKMMAPVLIGSQTTKDLKLIIRRKPKKISLNANYDVLSTKDVVEEM
jgi:aminopeptidase N